MPNTTTASVTSRDILRLANHCDFMRRIYGHLQEIHRQQEALAAAAPTLFSDIYWALREHLILQVCRITDPPQSMGRDNATILFILENGDFAQNPEVLAKLDASSAKIHAFRGKIRDARNRFISHLDREALSAGENLGAASDSDWVEFWQAVQDFLDTAHRHFVGHGLPMNVAAGTPSDVAHLVQALSRRQGDA